MTQGQRLERAYRFASALCQYAGEGEEFLENFWKGLCGEADLFEEFCYYMDNGTFACRASVEGYTVVDVMVWQIDHFKAALDRERAGMRDNGDKMLLMAFDTFIKMRKEPEKYVRRLRQETGTDYPEKY